MPLQPDHATTNTETTNESKSGFQTLQQRACDFLDNWRRTERYRHLLTTDPKQTSILDLTHNDYLGLRMDEVFQQKARQASTDLPVGSGASRLLGGEFAIFRELELAFAHFKGAPDALYFSSGYGANQACVTSLAAFGGRIYSDRHNHASIIDGVRLNKQERFIFDHGDTAQLEKELTRSDAPYNLIITESLFSMDGDRANLPELAALAKRFRGVLMIDEAHAIGCMGSGGAGLVPDAGLNQEEVITINACGKALGVQGALVCGPSWFRELLINTARPFIFTTAPSPWLAGALLASLNYVKALQARRQWLAQAALVLRGELEQQGFRTGKSSTHIIPILCGSDRAALSLSRNLFEQGVLARAVRPPTVAEGRSRVRLSLFSGMGEAGLEQLKRAFKKVADNEIP